MKYMMKSINADSRTTIQKKNERMINFYNNYEKEVTPVVEKYERIRIKSIINFILISFALILGEIIIFKQMFLENLIFHNGILGIGIGIVLYLGPIALAYYFINNSFQKTVKKDLLQNVIKGLGEIYWLPNKKLIDDEILRTSQLFATYNNRENDDTFQGRYNGLEFKISETEMKYISGGGRSRTVQGVFDGVIIIIDSNKKINAKTIITTKGDKQIRNSNQVILISILLLALPIMEFLFMFPFKLNILIFIIFVIIFGVAYIITKRLNKDNSMSNMQLEDPEFNKRYNVYTQDQVEGRYLVTPTFMERFKNLHTSFGTKMAKCAFFDSNIMFALSTEKNLFELSRGIFCSLKNPKQTKIFYEEISAIYDIIDYFKLDEKTGL